MTRCCFAAALLLTVAAPSAVADDHYSATASGELLTLTGEQLLGEPDTVLELATGPAHGSVDLLEAGSRIDYQSGPGFSGVDHFEVQGAGGEGGPTVWVHVSVVPLVVPVAGDWNGDLVTETGVYDTTTGTFYLYDANVTEPVPRRLVYPAAEIGWRPFAGDFDGDGFDEVGLYDPAAGVLHRLRAPEPPDDRLELLSSFVAGPDGAGEMPLAGRWDGGEGADGLALFLPGEPGRLRLWNATSGQEQTIDLAFGQAHWLPVVADWNGDKADSIGLYDAMTATLTVSWQAGNGLPDEVRAFGGVPAGQALQPVGGDWQDDAVDGESRHSLGLYDRSASPPGTSLFAREPQLVEAPIIKVVQTDPCCGDPPGEAKE